MANERKLNGELLILLSGLAALGALSTNIILPSFPAISAALQVPTKALGLTLSSFFIAFAFGQLAVGPLSDRYGRRYFVLGGLLVFLAGSLLCAMATTFPLLITGRVIQALGVCAASVLSRAIARDLFEGPALIKTLSLIMVAMAAAPGFSPLLGSAIDTYLGWRVSFVFVGVLGIGLALHYHYSIGETHPAQKRTRVSLAAVFKGYAGLFADRRFLHPGLSVSLIIGGLYAYFAMAPAILLEELGFTTLQLGLFFASTVLVVFASGLLAPRFARGGRSETVALIGFLLTLAGATILLIGSQNMGTVMFASAMTIFLTGMGLLNPLVTAMTLQPFGQQAGLASALLGFLQMGCAALATALPATMGFTASTSLGFMLVGSALLGVVIFALRKSSNNEI